MEDIGKILVPETASIKETMRVIDQGSIKTAIVVDKEGKLCGMVTDGDLRRGILNGIGINESVAIVMNRNPIAASVSDSPVKIINLIKKHNIMGVPLLTAAGVVKDFVLISPGDNLHYFRKHPEIRRHLERILVIGGAGYIGSVLVRKLLDKGYKVTVLDKFIYGRESLTEVSNHPNLTIIEGDTRHIEDVNKSIRDVDAVVHLAELVGDPACALNPAMTLEINYLATRAIAATCKHFQINRLVYASSCSVYGASKSGELLTETSELNPVSLYAKGKIESENALLELRDGNFSPTILRFATAFGLSYRPRFDLVVNLLTAKAMREGRFSIFGGDQWRPNVHVADVSDTIVAVLEAPIEDVGGQIFNVGSEENNHTINDIGRMVKEAIPSAEMIIDQQAVDKRDYRVGFGKLRETLKIRMNHGVRDGIAEIKAFLEKEKELDYQDKRHSNIKFLEDKASI
jgi:nucleoside-diphosphate-sugar epimerase